MSDTSFSLHPAQQEVYTDQLLNTNSPLYNIGGYIILKGALDKASFNKAINSAPALLDFFKLRFNLIEPDFRCHYDEGYSTFELSEHDFSHEVNPEESARAWTQERFNTAFTLTKSDLPFEQYLLKISETEHWFYGKYHHLITDGYGFIVWIQYIASKYHSLTSGQEIEFKYPLYRDEAIKANQYLSSSAYEEDAAYWKEKISSKPEKLLQKKYQSQGRADNATSLFNLELPDDKRQLIEELQRDTKSSLQQLTLAALLIYFGKTTSQAQFILGVPIHKRGSRVLRSIVGMFSGILPYKGSFNAQSTLTELLADIAGTQRSDYRHQNYPIGDLSRHLKLNNAEGYLYDVVVNYEPLNFELNFGDAIHASIVRLANEDERNPLQLAWRDYGPQQPLELQVHFATAYFNSEEIKALAQRIVFIIEQFPAALQRNIGSIDILSDSEITHLATFHTSSSLSHFRGSITERFNSIVEKFPNSIALSGESQLTYNQLNKQSNQLAHFLQKKGVKPEMMIPVCIERGIGMMVSILAILKAGGAYVPIDPGYPDERISFMLEDIEATIALSSKANRARLETAKAELLIIEPSGSDAAAINNSPDTEITHTPAPSQLAYVIYTSGSTGKPKGVLVEHQNVVSLITGVDYVDLTADDTLLVTGSPAFDATTFEYWGMLLNGGKLVLCSEEELLDHVQLKQQIDTHKVSTMWFTSSWFNQLTDTDLSIFEGLKTILVGGEQLSEEHIRKFWNQFSETKLINGYGPTENTTFSVTYNISQISEQGSGIPIGRPLSGREAYVLNSSHELVPLGVTGEIYLGGAGLSRGYLNQPELTAEKFIPNPFRKEEENNLKLYKTGDLGRWLPDGNLEYLGRADEQLKIRGYRIEPGEIEHILLQSGLVKQAVVIGKADGRGSKKLAAYVVADSRFSKENIQNYLSERLPDYMVPQLWKELESIPLTANGKTDKQALPEIDVTEQLSQGYAAPQTELEQKLASIWQELLNIERVGINNDFFELGGDSILAIQLVSRIRRLGYQLQPRDIFSQQTIGRLSEFLASQSGTAIAGEQGLLAGSCGLLPILQWYLQKAPETVSHFNQAVLLTIDKTVSESALQQTVQHLCEQHDALRFLYTQKENEWQQEYGSHFCEIITEDLKTVTAVALADEIQLKANQYQSSLDIKSGKLMQVVLMQTPETEANNRLLIIIHHLAVDGVSWRILLEELEDLLIDITNGSTIHAAIKGSSYRQWVEAIHKYSTSDALLSQLNYWEQIVKNYHPLAVDKESSEKIYSKNELQHTITLESEFTRQLLQEVPKAFQTEINDILLAALADTMGTLTGNKNLVIGLEGHGRESIADNIDTSRTVGWFTSLFPVMLTANAETDGVELIAKVKEDLRQIPDKGLGYGVLKFITKNESLQGNDPWDITFNYLGQLDTVLESSNLLGVATESTGSALSEDQTKTTKLSLESHIRNGELLVQWNYSSLHYHAETIEKLAERYKNKLVEFITLGVEKAQTVYFTPEGFSLNPEVNAEDLARFINQPDKKGQIESIHRLSSLQEGMLFHGLISSSSGAYISHFTLDLFQVDVAFFRKSWESVLQAHNILRSAFYHDDLSIPVQCVYRKADLEITSLDFSNMSAAQQTAALDKYIKTDSSKGFEFKKAPLTRFALVQLSAEKYKMIWTTHHIIFDGWSLPVLVEEFLTNYELLARGNNLPAKKVDDYGDYIQYLQKINKADEEKYWRNYLAGVEQSTLLPFIKNQSDRTKGVGSYQSVTFQPDAAAVSRTKEYAQKNHLTVNTLMQGVWAYLLSYYTQNEHVVYAVTVSGRPDDLENIEQRVGMYINTLPLHAHVQADTHISKWLQSIQADQVSSRQYQHTPINEIQKWSGIQGDFFDSLLVFLNYPVSRLMAKKWLLQPENVFMHEQNNFPLTITIGGTGELSVVFTYNTDLLKEEHIQQISKNFESVLSQITEASGTLNNIKLLSQSEEQEVLNQFNNNSTADSDNLKSVIDIIRERVDQDPENTAIVYEQSELSYRELEERSNQLAHYLKNKGVTAETLVPICLYRSPEIIISILAVLKAGGAFVPVDPDYPQERISYMLQDTKASLVISSKSAKSKLDGNTAAQLIELDGADKEAIYNSPTTGISQSIAPNQLAYVIYTSGSTGQPKGVMIEHGSLLNYLVNSKTRYTTDVEGNAGSFIHLSYTFDASITALFMPLLAGKLMVIASTQVVNVFDDANLWNYAPYDFIKLTPVHLSLLSDAVSDTNRRRLTNKFVVGGEALLLSYFDTYLDKSLDAEAVNEYGPTEATVGCSTYTFNISGNNQKIKDSIPIGKPLDNTTLYVLGTKNEVLPAGIAGELYIGGSQVARGYLNREDLTAEKFIANPFGDEPGARLYKTGDLARWLPNGNLEYLGRIDDQVKVRGYRIELGEIESVLQQHEQVKQAVVLAKEDASGHKQLVGYVVAADEFEKDELEAFLQSKLPEYMVPSLWVQLDKLPVTPNGKIDKKALPDPDASTQGNTVYAAPRNETEQKLVAIWQTLLELDEIGINDDFFDIGGHSLLAIRVTSSIRREMGIELSINDIFDYPTIAQLAEKIADESENELLPSINVISPRPARIPLSFSQERLWFIDQLEGSVQYHITAVIRLQGSLDISAFESSIKEIVNRHEILRTVYGEESGRAYQEIKPEGQWFLQVTDNPAYRQSEALQKYIALQAHQTFDLSNDHMLRAELIVISDTEHVLLVTMHHIASDAWSMPIMVREVAELYRANTENRSANLAVLPLQYADYSIWQKGYLSGDLLESKLNYWKEKLDGVTPLQLPTDFSRPAEMSARGASAEFLIPQELNKRLLDLSKRHGATMYMTLLSAFKVLLFRYSGQEDISVGTSIAGRPQQELEGLIGFFVNTLALRNQLSSEMTFTELLEDVRLTMLEAYTHQEVPFERVVESVVKDRDASRSPLFQVMLVLRNTPEVPALELGDLILTGEPFKHTTVKFDLTFFLTETANGLEGSVLYSTDLFHAARIGRMMKHFIALLESVVSTPQELITKLTMLSVDEKTALTSGFNVNRLKSIPQKTLLAQFEEQAKKHPDSTALAFEGNQLTFSELNSRSNQLAHYLISKGVKADTLVPLFIERGPEMIIGLLGILKAGAAYVPIDTDFPEDRIRFMLEDTSAHIVLCSASSKKKLTDSGNLEMVELDGDQSIFSSISTENPEITSNPQHILYVIYTSGSTGRPKGVLVEHGNMLDYVQGLDERTGINSCRSYALVSTMATDLGNTTLFSWLVSGGTLHVFSKDAVSHIEHLHDYFDEHRIDCLKIVPSHWKALTKDGEPLLPRRLLVFGGEALQGDVVRTIYNAQANCRVVNHYGPTETTVGKLLFEVDLEQEYGITVPIGKPFSDSKIYVLGRGGELCPIGVPGELHIGGAGVARGYLNNEELTTEKFIPNPVDATDNLKLYKTGDLVSYDDEGNIVFLGRVDDQVKIRGYRVEPSEIGRVLEGSNLIRQAVVIANDDHQGNKQLVAYIVAADTFDREGITGYARELLPEYMVPVHLVELESIPLTANGKVDRKALPSVDSNLENTGEYVAPRNDVETQLAEIWQDVLEVDQVGVHDDFFELGGHSLLAVRLISAVRKAFKVELPISDVFDYPSVAALAAQLGKPEEQAVASGIQALHPRPEFIPLSFSQERLWFIDRMEGSVQYHVPAVLRLRGNLNVKALNNALKDIVNRHEVLRTSILEKDGQAYQIIKEPGKWNLTLVDKPNPAGLEELIQQIIQAPFDLSKDDMIRGHLITVSEQEYMLVVTSHHIASDGWSRSILVRELVSLYKAFNKGLSTALEPLQLQYADYAIWQRSVLQGDLLDKKLDYWQKKLNGVAALNLPTDFVRPAIQSTKGAILGFNIDAELTENIHSLSKSQGTTLYMTLLAAYKVLLHRYSGQEDICVGSGIAGRQQQELEGLIGFFVNTLAMRSEVRGDMPFTEFLQAVKVTTMEAYSHQEVPFEKVVDAVANDRDLSRNPVFQVTFVVQNTPEVPNLLLEDVELAIENYDHLTSKFDITFSVTEAGKELQVLVEYCADLYLPNTIERMASHFEQLLRSITAQPDQKIAVLPILTAAEEEELLEASQSTGITYNQEDTLISLFQQQALKTPAQTALVFQNIELSYRELNERANQLAHYLQSKGVTAETLVPICIERSPEMIIGILGILKAGGAYVPIDSEYPADRIRFMLEDTCAQLVVSSRFAKDKVVQKADLQIIEIDGADSEAINGQPKTNLQVEISPEQSAYIIYTSGSTGKPKGVIIEHKSAVNLVHVQTKYFAITLEERILQFSNYCFDASVEQIFLALSNGAPLVLFPEGLQYDIPAFETYLREQKISHLHATPFFLENITPGNYQNLKRVIAGGDVCRKELAARWKDTVGFYNEYGPTETTVTAVEYHAEPSEDRGSIPIGKSLANVSLYILDQNGVLCPEGIPGELYIGGVQVARGYLNRSELTAERFITNPLKGKENERLYRTGDLIRRLSDGNLEYLGRIDDQVKLRGYRIELGEIESVLNELEPVENSCVVVKPDATAGSRLVAYYVPKAESVKKKEHELYSQQIESWKEIHENEYVLAEEEKVDDPEFNILGWNNSFTRQPIEAWQMREWLEDITEVILAQNPGQVLEIGSGSGLIYYQLAGKVKKYTGTDFSKHSINKIAERIKTGLRDYGPTELQVCAAHEVSLKENEEPDTIIINSVVQYFPGGDYLHTVIKKGIALLKGSGRIIIGDVRDNRTLHLFKTRLQLAKLQDQVNLDEFKWAVDQEVLKEEELCFSPEYFYNLREVYPEITHVDIQWKQGSYINELSLYRFTAVIYVGIERPVLEPQWQSWNIGESQNLLSILKEGKDIVAIKDVPNPRLWQEKQLLSALNNSSANTTKDLEDAIEVKNPESNQVEELLAESKSQGYNYRFLLHEDPLKINILFEKERSTSFINSPYTIKTNRGALTNVPLFADISLLLQKEIRLLLQQRLPDYMVPSEFSTLDHLPLNSNGKVNRKFLSQTADRVSGDKSNYQPPTNATEQTLARIWQELLAIERAGIHDNFFELGGHSLLGMRVISAIRKELEVEMVIKDLFVHPTIAELAAFLKLQNKGLLFPTIEVQARPEFIPLSYSQERLWFIDQLEGSTRYHLSSVLRLKGKLNVDELEHALQTSVNRHEVLRTVIRENGGQGYQYVLQQDAFKLHVADDFVYQGQKDLELYIKDLVKVPFDLSADHMFRASLIALTETEHILVVTMHHIASDAWSMSVIVNEVVEVYSSYIENRRFILPTLEIQYADYSVWQRKYLNGEILNQKINYWKQKLADVLPLQLPADYSRPAVWSGRGAIKAFNINRELTQGLLSISKQQGATLFIVLQAAFKVLLHRYSRQEDICIGTSVANRTQKEVEGLIGFFVNMLALRSHVNSESKFTELLQQVKATTMEAYEQQDVPFEKVVDAVIKDRDMSRNPLVQVMLILLNTPEVPEMLLGEVTLTLEEQEHTTTLFDLSFFATESPDGLHVKVQYGTDLYSEETIERMIGHFKELLHSIVSNPEQKVGKLNLLSADERNLLLIDFNKTESEYPAQQSIAQVFEAQVSKTPEAIAIEFEGETLTYSQLNRLSNQLAHHLIGKGLKPGTLVPVCIGRSLELLIGILGVLKAGGAYVPVDPEYPEARIRYMLQDTSASVAVSTSENKAFLQASEIDIDIIELDSDSRTLKSLPADNLSVSVKPDDLAYVIYTSGSTGTPKGVLVEQGNVVSLVKGVDYVNLNAEDTLLSTGSPSFDASTFEYWGMLLNGGRLILCSENRLLNSELLKNEIVSNGVTKMWFTSSWFNQLVETDISVFETLNSILVGGEKLSEKHIQQVLETYPTINIINGYGPTENTTFSLTYKIENVSAEKTIPIGKPLNNRTAYILDAQLELCPVGITGEIYVGGAGLSRGYLNRPELTEERFIPNPYASRNDCGLYKTGDLGRWLPDGNIEFTGRADDQVKIRGYRIELGEIEKVLEQSEQISQAVVLAHADGNGNKRLVGYVQPVDTFDKEAVRSFLLGKLPEYMVPALWVEVESMPLTSNGKVDKKALPDPDLTELQSQDFTAPRDEFEEKLAEIWQDLLGIDQVGIHDNFFELGGDSILTIQVVSRMRRLGYEFQVNDIFTHQTIEQLSKIIGNGSSQEQAAEQGLLEGDCELLPIQQWFFEMDVADNSHFNQSVLLSLDKAVTASALNLAVKQLVNQHDALRFAYSKTDGRWKQEYKIKEGELTIADLTAVSTDALGSEITEQADNYQRSLDIEKGELVRIVLMQTPAAETHNRLFIAVHHLAVDGVSWRILLDDLEALLTGIAGNLGTDLGTKGSSYRQWQKALQVYGTSKNLLEQKEYWKQVADNYEPFPRDHPYDGLIRVKDISNHSIQLDSVQTLRLLQEVPRVYHTEINDILLSALAKTLCDRSKKDKLVIGLEGHGREDISKEIDTSRTVGWFTSLYPIALQAALNAGADDLIKGVKEQLRRIPDKGIGYGVLKYINKESTLEGDEPWDIVFNYLGQLDGAVSESKWLKGASESAGAGRSSEQLVKERLSVDGYVRAGVLMVRFNYSNLQFKEETIAGLAADYLRNLEWLIAHCIEVGKSGTVYTPSDYGIGSEVSYEELDKFLEEDDDEEDIMSF